MPRKSDSVFLLGPTVRPIELRFKGDDDILPCAPTPKQESQPACPRPCSHLKRVNVVAGAGLPARGRRGAGSTRPVATAPPHAPTGGNRPPTRIHAIFPRELGCVAPMISASAMISATMLRAQGELVPGDQRLPRGADGQSAAEVRCGCRVAGGDCPRQQGVGGRARGLRKPAALPS